MKLVIKVIDKAQAVNAIKTIKSVFEIVTEKIDFEGFLMEKHAEQYVGTKDCMVDDFPEWLGDLDPEDLIKYGNQYAEKMRLK